MSHSANKYKIIKLFPEIEYRYGVKLPGLKDREVAQFIAKKTGWPVPSKKQRKVFFVRFLNEFCGCNERYPAGRQPRKPRSPRKAYRSNNDFYMSDAWRQLRYRALKKFGATCQCCGASPKDGRQVHVDHIKPRSKYPALELEFSNLQVLCEACNIGKLHLDETDWRPTELVGDELDHMKSILQ